MIGLICLLVGWLGIAWGVSKTNFIQGPQGQHLEGYERVIAALSWPYVLVVILAVFAVAAIIMGYAWMKGR